jgi:hypothetical protein
MRLPVVLLLCSLAGILGGAALIGVWALGVAIICDSVCVGAFALLRDWPDSDASSAHDVPTLRQVLERARAA